MTETNAGLLKYNAILSRINELRENPRSGLRIGASSTEVEKLEAAVDSAFELCAQMCAQVADECEEWNEDEGAATGRIAARLCETRIRAANRIVMLTL